MHRRFCVFLSILLCLSLTGCAGGVLFSPIDEADDPETNAQYIVDILPDEQSDTYHMQTATLYYKHYSEDILVGVQAEFSLALGQTIEEAVINALIDGPGEYHDLSALIPDGTRLISLIQRDAYLEVTLSNEFFFVPAAAPSDWESDPSWREVVYTQRRLATYSIVNALASLGHSPSVLLLIDTEETGNGQRLGRSYFGLEIDTQDVPMEPLTMDVSYVFTPAKSAALVFESIIRQDTDQLSRFLVTSKTSSSITNMITSQLYPLDITSFSLPAPEALVSVDGQSCVLLTDITTGSTLQSARPLVLRLENNIWKVDFDCLCSILQ